MIGILLAGCVKSGTYIIPNTTLHAVHNAIHDYVGMNGFKITYEKVTDNASTYRIFLGESRYITPSESETVLKRESVMDLTENANSAEETSFTNNNQVYQTITKTYIPSETIVTNQSVSIRIQQEGSDVKLFIESKGGVHPRRYAKKFLKLLTFQGLAVSKG